MNETVSWRSRVLSGMRPTGMLHLGHYFLLQKWVAIQADCDCYFFVADYHALTTMTPGRDLAMQEHIRDMLICWLAAGIDPDRSVLFLQSQLREHAELHLLLSMVAPLPWLERIPHFKDMTTKMQPEEISYGFLGYPVLQSADIMVHGADKVPVGDDQEAHVEMAARLARRFNDQFGKDPGWRERGLSLVKELPDAGRFTQLCCQAQQEGDAQARFDAVHMVETAGLGRESTQRLLGWVDAAGRQILKPPQVMKAETSRLLGLDGNKMSKSSNNDIGMLEGRESHFKKVKAMPTDPARVRRTDKGNPERCPVWPYHKLFSPSSECENVKQGCTSAGIGCVDCKALLSDNIEKVIAPLRERARPWQEKPARLEEILSEGTKRARESASLTMREVREAVGLSPV